MTFKTSSFRHPFFLLLSVALIFFSACSDDDNNQTSNTFEEIVAVANRADGSVSFVDAETDMVLESLSIPDSEPMYVVYVPARDRIYVGDRKGSSVHVINPDSRTVESTIQVGNGVFHMWADGDGEQLWVNNDIDNTVSVIDLETGAVVETIEVGAKPHDVFVANNGTKAYVSIINPDENTPDQVFMYSTTTYEKTGEQNVGKDPHLFHLSGTDRLFVPCQSGEVYVLDGNNLSEISVSDYEGAHGIFPTPDQQTVLVTNISGAQLYAIQAANPSLTGSPATTLPVPHNIVVNESASKAFVTHSGPSANSFSVFSINEDQTLTSGPTLTVGLNPFGLAYYRRMTN